MSKTTDSAITTYEVLVNQASIQDAIQVIELLENPRAEFPAATLDLLPSHIRLARAELDLLGVLRREDRLAAAIRQVKSEYDIIVIDCPPSLGILTLNALIAASEVLIPVEPGYFPLIGIGLLQQTISDVAQINDLYTSGAIPTMQDRTVESRETADVLARMFGDSVLPSIPNRVAIRNAHAAQMDIFGYATDATSQDAANSFVTLIKEVVHA